MLALLPEDKSPPLLCANLLGGPSISRGVSHRGKEYVLHECQRDTPTEEVGGQASLGMVGLTLYVDFRDPQPSKHYFPWTDAHARLHFQSQQSETQLPVSGAPMVPLNECCEPHRTSVSTPALGTPSQALGS